MKSARINFGQPNTEYKLEINEAGEATSCYNQDTDTEYIGGGGESNLSTAEVTFVINAPAEDLSISIPAIWDSEEWAGISVTHSVINGDVLTVPLYKGACDGGIDLDDYNISDFSGTGSVVIDADSGIVITGNCTITYLPPAL